MTNDFKPIGFKKAPFIPKTETRIFLGGRPIDQQTEQTGSKGISKQHYQSEKVNEINPGYGPCSYSGCSNSEIFNLKIGFKQSNLFNWHFKDFSGVINGGDKFSWLVFKNVQAALIGVENLEQGTYEVVGATGDWDTERARSKKSEVVSKIRGCIHSHEEGYEINEEVNFTDSSGMPPRWENGREVYQGTNAFDW
ncbi:MAG: hypothetical protein MRECE_57c005 [Mycoplasmataceae bacterium CE_OT135]|nr:MAG: hypothetical protein MRECE_57c005 [Mycoplasmataceae bacterium CE_OT135]